MPGPRMDNLRPAGDDVLDVVAEIFGMTRSGTANSNKPPREEMMASPERLWFRCYEAADEFLDAVDKAMQSDGNELAICREVIRVLNEHVVPLTDAVYAVKEHELAEALREDLAYEGAFRGAAVMPSMRVSLPGLFANVVSDVRRKDQRNYYQFALSEVLRHLRETIAGEHTLEEFAEFYCLKKAPPNVARARDELDGLLQEIG